MGSSLKKWCLQWWIAEYFKQEFCTDNKYYIILYFIQMLNDEDVLDDSNPIHMDRITVIKNIFIVKHLYKV